MYYMNERWRGGAPYINFAFPYSMMKVTTILITAACLAGSFSLYADAVSDQEEAASSTGAYSVAGALRLPENVTKRDVYGMNVGWKLFKGEKAPEEAASRMLTIPPGSPSTSPTALSFFRKRPAAVPTTRAGMVPENIYSSLPAGGKEKHPVF